MASKIAVLPGELYQNRKLILRLAKNDFKTKYAGSYLGIVWAFVQPVVTILVYWFVFSTMRAGMARQVPYVLWMIAGMVPWFFFQDGLNNGTNALVEYSYLVKKVVFKISILPIVKLVSALFVHLFFIGVVLVLYAVMGYFPGLSVIQVLYYSFSMFILVLGITYLTSAVVIFFRDLSQIISIFLQVGVWLTPIMWNFEDLHLTGIITYIFKLNPMYYIVEGYRDSLITGRWFWERPVLTLYYWAFTLVVFWLGTRVFKRLRVHFADVL
ncbi:MAG: ABC transporter permease [Lachnospiraceae bacterium]|nr:ABC transporter permease [Lachnospiraceae bacterium]